MTLLGIAHRWVERLQVHPERALRQVAAGIVLALGVALPLLATLAGSTPEATVTTSAAVAVALVVAVAAGLALRGAQGLPAVNGRSGTLLAWSLVAWAVGAAGWAGAHAGAGAGSVWDAPTGAAWAAQVGDAAFVVCVALYCVAILGHPMLAPASFRRRTVTDAAILGLAVATTLWLFAGRTLWEATRDPFVTAAALSWVLVDTALAVVCCWALTRLPRHHRLAGSARLLAIGFATIAAGDVTQVVARAQRVPGTAPWLVTEICWAIGACCVATAIWVARGTVDTRRSRVDPVRLRGTLEALTVGAVIVVAVLTTGSWALAGSVEPVGLVLLSALVGLVLWRQALTLDRNEQLASTLARSVDDLAHQATHDHLTGLPNRVGLAGRITEAISGAARRHQHVALMFVDLDHLKPVNDSLGHAAGDELIRTVSERLVARLGGGVTRFGGDEFVVLIDDAPTLRAVDALADAIVRDSAATTTIDGYTVRPSVSVGYAIAEVGDDPEELLRRADVALYRAKSLGRRRVARYDPSNPDDARRQVDLEPELRRAVRDDEFEVHYQPIVELATGRIVAVESLLRWRHPTRGLLAPAHFLDEAASAGLLGEIGERTLRVACRDHASTGLRCSVNLSTSELTDARVVERVQAALRDAQLPAAQLTLEITEDVIVDAAVRRTIDALRRLGVALAVDDFGTGNSSLRQLGTYPATVIKIDRSFTSQLSDRPEASAIVAAVVDLGSRLGMTAVAEGVEHPAQRRALVELGCELAQGWHFGRPAPIAQLRQLLGSGATLPVRDPSTSDAEDTMRSSSSATVGRSSIVPTT